MISLGKEGSLHAQRRAAAYIRAKRVVSKLFKDLAGRFAERHGGYTRIIKTRRRGGDAAPIAVIELVTRPVDKKEAGKRGAAPQENAGQDCSENEGPAGLQEFSFAQSKGGLVDWKIHARQAQLFEADAKAVLNDVHVTLMGTDGVTMTVAGDEGTINITSKDFVISKRSGNLALILNGGLTI